eukprot:3660603-Prymnesium_polylepis.1
MSRRAGGLVIATCSTIRRHPRAGRRDRGEWVVGSRGRAVGAGGRGAAAVLLKVRHVLWSCEPW